MNEQVSASELKILRDRVAELEAARAQPFVGSGMEGFRQLGEAIEQNRLQSFFWKKGSSALFRYAVLAGILAIWALILFTF